MHVKRTWKLEKVYFQCWHVDLSRQPFNACPGLLRWLVYIGVRAVILIRSILKNSSHNSGGNCKHEDDDCNDDEEKG